MMDDRPSGAEYAYAAARDASEANQQLAVEVEQLRRRVWQLEKYLFTPKIRLQTYQKHPGWKHWGWQAIRTDTGEVVARSTRWFSTEESAESDGRYAMQLDEEQGGPRPT